jgi:hypothetical protein
MAKAPRRRQAGDASADDHHVTFGHDKHDPLRSFPKLEFLA